MASIRPDEERSRRLRLAQRRRHNMRQMLAEAQARARRMRGLPPGDGPDSADAGEGSMLRVWMLFMGAALIILTVISIIAIFTEETATAQPPQFGVVQAALAVESCNDALVLVSSPPAEFFTGELAEQGGLLSRGRVEQYADDLLANYVGFAEGDVPSFVAGPYLLNATLPNGDRRAVWARGWIPGRAGGSNPPGSGNIVEGLEEAVAGATGGGPNAVVLYLDPETGQPLVLYEGVRIETPLLAGCEVFVGEAIETLWRRLMPSRQTIGLLVGMIAGTFTLAFWQRRKLPPGAAGGGGGDRPGFWDRMRGALSRAENRVQWPIEPRGRRSSRSGRNRRTR